MKFSMTEAWREATAMMAANREVLLIVGGIFFLLPSLALALIMPGMDETLLADPDNTQAAVMELYSNWWWLLLLVVLVQIVGYLAMLALLRDTTRPTVGDAIKTGLFGLLPVIGVYLVLGVGMAALMTVVALVGRLVPALAIVLVLLMMVAAIYVFVRLMLVLPAIAIDKIRNPLAAMARSWRLTKGNALRLLAFMVLLVVVYLVISIVVGLILSALIFAVGIETAVLINAVLSGLLGAALTVVFVAVVAATHRQLANAPEAGVSAAGDPG